MTDDSMALMELAEKHADGDFLRELGQYTLQRLMDIEAQAQCGAERNERNEDRVNQRNGYRDRDLQTRIGSLALRIPKLRQGSYMPSFLNPRKSSERALVAVVQEAYVKGVSTRKVDDLMQAMGMTGISKSQVSRLCKELDGRVQQFLERQLSGQYLFLWLDATYLKVRDNGHVVSKAVIVAVGVHEGGCREVLGLAVGPAETEAFWRETADKLRERFPKLGALMDRAEDDVLAFMQYPKEIWPQLASTNSLERLNKEIKRRSRVVEIFPNDAAVVRLVGTLLAEHTDEWQVTRRYMSQETMKKSLQVQIKEPNQKDNLIDRKVA
jgi:transposase-like protein